MRETTEPTTKRCSCDPQLDDGAPDPLCIVHGGAVDTEVVDEAADEQDRPELHGAGPAERVL